MDNLTIGLDLGDRYSQLCAIDPAGRPQETCRIRTTPADLTKCFATRPAARVIVEAGTHSPWVSRQLASWGHEVIVANPRKLRLIYANPAKSDRADAEYLARVGRLDPQLLAGIRHRSAAAQAALGVLRTRDILVRTRTQLINHVRGVVKAVGGRITGCSAEAFPRRAAAQLPDDVRQALTPVLEQVHQLTHQIRAYDQQVEQLGQLHYPETRQLRQVTGVGPITALAFVLILEDPARFRSSRQVGAYLGLQPRRRQSGAADPQLRISKTGDAFLRRLLVQAAQYILGPHGPPCDLRRHGEQIAARGGGNAKKRAVVAVARKLAVLLHHLWRSGDRYLPVRPATQA